jgi:hypothetical protein
MKYEVRVQVRVRLQPPSRVVEYVGGGGGGGGGTSASSG